ncbi:GNAT family N-acetyltransferase [Myroides injenensis]|uniref:GNAT family N-acetyltransferase n=1 Tax=Myroides injenensis TaxID=1183151 RepID=UPI00226D4FBB|nr:GNAT family N-acetyltransferase [Myroides injenensis]
MLTNNIPLLETVRLQLRPLKETDAKALFSYFSKDEVTEFYDLYTFKKEEEALNLINIWKGRVITKEGLRWAITLNGSDELIGTCGFHNFSIENNRAEIGYDLHPMYWGKGIMTEAISSIIEYGFDVLKLHRIEAFIDPANHASRRLLQKNGLEVEGVLRDYFFEKERFVDAEMLSILNK